MRSQKTLKTFHVSAHAGKRGNVREGQSEQSTSTGQSNSRGRLTPRMVLRRNRTQAAGRKKKKKSYGWGSTTLRKKGEKRNIRGYKAMSSGGRQTASNSAKTAVLKDHSSERSGVQ